jgi:3-isopropylmalate/(R)-2-methylmalate dehydratase large subunit
MNTPRTLYDKIVDSHCVRLWDEEGDQVMLYVDRTVLNEYTSPQAFTGLRDARRKVWCPEAALGVVDHVNPTAPERSARMADPEAEAQTSYFARNCRDFGIALFDVLHPMQGIEHVVMPELGKILPGMVIAAGDSHTTTYGAFGALGFGIGTSDIEHYLATQTVIYRRLASMLVTVEGDFGVGVTPKDLVMTLIRDIGADGATGCAMEFVGSAISAMSLEGRMTICNMAVECGARGALIAPDELVYAYLRPRSGLSDSLWERARDHWRTLRSDPGAFFALEHRIRADDVEPMVTWGTSPDQAVSICSSIPDPEDEQDPRRRAEMRRALDYMGLRPGMDIASVPIDRAFIGSCTNSRIEDLRSAAAILKGRRVREGVKALVVPGSSEVRRQAEQEGLDRIFKAAGFEWRQSGCSMCLAMNDDGLAPLERCASSTNRNFEGRQGARGRTHLMSPAMVAAAAVAGHLTDCRALELEE